MGRGVCARGETFALSRCLGKIDSTAVDIVHGRKGKDNQTSARNLLMCYFRTQDFRAILMIIFRNLPGSRKVSRGEYRLHDGQFILKENSNREISRRKGRTLPWSSLIRPGGKIFMDAAVRWPGAYLERARLHSRICPRCSSQCCRTEGGEFTSRMRW